MSTKYFNFNHEQDLTPIEMDDNTGAVTINLGDETQDFDSMQSFAEFYAKARNVKPENLKNWVLIQDGDTYAFTLRTGTAGMDADELTNLVKALKGSGMSAEDIGKAVRAATTESKTDTEDEDNEDEITSAVNEAIDDLDNVQVEAIRYAIKNGLNSLGAIVKLDELDNDNTFEHDMKLIKSEFSQNEDLRNLYRAIKNGQVTEDEDDLSTDCDDYDFDDVDRYHDLVEDNYDEDGFLDLDYYEIVTEVLHNTIDDVEVILDDASNNLPLELSLLFAMRKDIRNEDEVTNMVNDYNKSLAASMIAGRNTVHGKVVNYDINDDEATTMDVNLGFRMKQLPEPNSQFVMGVDSQSEANSYRLYEINNHFYIVKMK